jgi:hypothetical protein
MKKQIIYTLFFALSGFAAIAQETMHPSPAQSKTIVISGGTIHVGNEIKSKMLRRIIPPKVRKF